jgi:hypothetical protein
MLVSALALAGAPAAYADGTDAAAQLAQRYAPVVVVQQHSTECGAGQPYLPTTVETALGKADVVLRGPDGRTFAAPTAADLAGKGPWTLLLTGWPLWVTNLVSIVCSGLFVPSATIGLTLLYYDLGRRAQVRAEAPDPLSA